MAGKWTGLISSALGMPNYGSLLGGGGLSSLFGNKTDTQEETGVKKTIPEYTPLMDWMKTRPWYQTYQMGSGLGKTLGLWK